jgi:PKD repeat protein
MSPVTYEDIHTTVFVVLELKERGMKRIPGHNLIILCCTVILVGWCIFPVTAALCDGPPQSQSFILFSGGCYRSPPSLPCTQGFIFPAQPSVGGDFPTQYSLDFDDGSPPYYGSVDGVTHTYNGSGLFTLKFMAGTQCDLWRRDTFVMNIPAPVNNSPVIPACVPVQPSAGFIGSTTAGVAPLTVQFTGTSSGANAYAWSFGDGGTSPAQNPLHTYRTPGIYSVSLEARDACSGTVNRAGMSDFVTVTTPVTTISVASNPPGAAVFIDNAIKGITPLTLTDTAIGNHRITITMDGYEEYTRNIMVEAATPRMIAAELTRSAPQPTTRPPPMGSIAITSIPSGAEVYIDGTQRGIAPAIFTEVLPGNHQVTLSLKGNDDWSHIVSVGSGQMAAINAILVATKEITGSLAVITDPPGAEIFIDGNFKGVSPVTIPELSAGTHTVLLTLQEYADTTTNISVTAGQTQKYTSGLQKVYKPSAIDLLLAAGAIVLIAVIALVVMFRKAPKTR